MPDGRAPRHPAPHGPGSARPVGSDDEAEDALIGAVLAASPGDLPEPPWLAAGDDAAVLPPNATPTAWTVDTLVEGLHWDGRLTPEDVGHKALAVSVSDLAATGARPRWALLSLSLPPGDAAWVHRFAHGLGEAQRRWAVHLIGGDTTGTAAGGPRTVSLTLGGPVVAEPLRRDGAQVGDTIWVTGALGLAGAGWRLPDPPPAALAALRRPEPPVAFALALAAAGLATAGLDLSDGLARDLPRLARASGVALHVDPALLPGAPALGLPPGSDAALLHQTAGGEDYQLLFTAPPSARPALEALAAAHATPLTAIGQARAGEGAHLRGADWPAPWRHPLGEAAR